MPTGSVNGIALRYKIGGPPDNEVLVLLHGWTASHQHGEHDIIPLHHAEAAHRAIPGSKLVVMKDCGHLPSLEMPEETQRLILEFAASL